MIARAAALLLCLGLFSGCQGEDKPTAAPTVTPSISSVPVPAKPAPRPRVGRCYPLAYDAASAPTSATKPVPCTARHTAETFFVGSLDTVVAGHLLTVDSERVQRQVATSCPARLAAFVGGSPEQRRLSMLSTVWFSPTVVQSDAGHNWYRCEVVATGAPDRLDRLVGPMKGVLGTPEGRDRYGMCGTDRPGTAGFTRVACAHQHAWRAVSTVDVPASAGGRLARGKGGPCGR